MSGDRELRVATVGCGYFSQFHHDAWTRVQGARLIAVCDLDLAKAVATGERFGGVRAFADAREMVETVRPDLLDIIAPPAAHRDLLRAAGVLKVDVVCQKPLAEDFHEAKTLVGMAETAGVRFIVHENFRFQPWYREAARLLDAGRLGRPYGITFRLRPGDGRGPHAYRDRQPYFQRMERFLVHETAIHFIDTFRFLLGEVEAVFASLRRLNPAIAGEDAGTILFRFAAGPSGLFDGNRLSEFVADDPRRTMGEMWIEGEEAVLRLDGAGRLWLKPHGQPEAQHSYSWSDTGFGGDCVQAFQQHVVDHLTRGAPLETAAHDYLRNVLIEDAVYRSADHGRWVEV